MAAYQTGSVTSRARIRLLARLARVQRKISTKRIRPTMAFRQPPGVFGILPRVETKDLSPLWKSPQFCYTELGRDCDAGLDLGPGIIVRLRHRLRRPDRPDRSLRRDNRRVVADRLHHAHTVLG